MATLTDQEIKIIPIFSDFKIESTNSPKKNGQFVISEYSEKSMHGSFLPYEEAKHYKRAAVSGIVIAKDGILIARRSETVDQYPDFFECAPSGGLCQEDFEAQLYQELEEEVRFGIKDIERSFLLFLIEDVKANTVDICSLIKMQEFFKPIVNKEYVDAQWIYLDELSSYSYQHRQEFVPTSLVLIEKAKEML
ncbi:MAG: hypothetical protein K940chlam8_00090 [Chlamydiae bacterium]|nr:hypothetical protein [Chlamydiota bacterium]